MHPLNDEPALPTQLAAVPQPDPVPQEVPAERPRETPPEPTPNPTPDDPSQAPDHPGIVTPTQDHVIHDDGHQNTGHQG